MQNLFEAPPSYTLLVSMGNDISVTLNYGSRNSQLDFVPSSWPDGATVSLVINDNPRIVSPAVISGSVAVMNVDYLIADNLHSGMLWWIAVKHPNGLDEVIVHGMVERSDF